MKTFRVRIADSRCEGDGRWGTWETYTQYQLLRLWPFMTNQGIGFDIVPIKEVDDEARTPLLGSEGTQDNDTILSRCSCGSPGCVFPQLREDSRDRSRLGRSWGFGGRDCRVPPEPE